MLGVPSHEPVVDSSILDEVAGRMVSGKFWPILLKDAVLTDDAVSFA